MIHQTVLLFSQKILIQYFFRFLVYNNEILLVNHLDSSFQPFSVVNIKINLKSVLQKIPYCTI